MNKQLNNKQMKSKWGSSITMKIWTPGDREVSRQPFSLSVAGFQNGCDYGAVVSQFTDCHNWLMTSITTRSGVIIHMEMIPRRLGLLVASRCTWFVKKFDIVYCWLCCIIFSRPTSLVAKLYLVYLLLCMEWSLDRSVDRPMDRPSCPTPPTQPYLRSSQFVVNGRGS